MSSENQTAEQQSRSLWRDLSDAIRGTEIDYTQAALGRSILLLAVPMILEMMLESVFAVVDIFFVSKLGPSAVATVGLTESLMTLVYAVCIGLAMGTTAIVARRIGEKDKVGAANAASQGILVGLISAIPLAALGLFFAKDILTLMGADAWSIEHGYRYTAWMLGSNVVIMLLFINNAIFRGAGDAAIAMRVLWIANGINIILDPIFIFGWGPIPAMGVEGAAIATTIGRGFGVAMQFWVLLHGAKHIKIEWAQLRLQTDVFWHLIRTSLGGIGQFIIATSSWIGLVRIMSTFGSEAVAGYTIAIRIFIFTLLPAWGLSNAAATLVGQNLGAKQPERAEKSVWITSFYAMGFLLLVSIAYVIFSEELVRLFTDNESVVAFGGECLRVVSYGYIIYAVGMVLVQSFNGAGDTMTPTKINFFCYWLFEIPLAYVLALVLDLGPSGVYWSIVAAETAAAVVAIILFRQGKWKLKVV